MFASPPSVTERQRPQDESSMRCLDQHRRSGEIQSAAGASSSGLYQRGQRDSDVSATVALLATAEGRGSNEPKLSRGPVAESRASFSVKDACSRTATSNYVDLLTKIGLMRENFKS
jgi:hypothetical protein